MADKTISYWLMKSEPEVYGIDQLKKEKKTLWDGIRNYQARNFMRKMKVGDRAFFYHSNCKPPCIIGLMEVVNTQLVDPTQFDPDSRYFDPKSNNANPRWDCTEMLFVGKFTLPLSLEKLKGFYSGEELQIVKKGNRLSIIPVTIETTTSLLSKLGNLEE